MEKLIDNKDVKEVEQEQSKKRGGARKGAGRKIGNKSRKKQVSFYLTDQQWEALENEAAAANCKLGTYLNKREEAYANELLAKRGISDAIEK
ncbi:hypothetical protein [Bacillus sp. FJAT-26390]|uniref:hypothetical protein n=1 Tax=Bacillus sp. FJAT-26390 TaxID=1743142 RepID=UPI000807B6A0|nr:hypothetical protein [Bacillus sp. FJAT-26390]OBZ09121.1 hypothetical protein A7975_23685 [Bacillus sp. FJAT-26390]